jgi:hypothetical protein
MRAEWLVETGLSPAGFLAIVNTLFPVAMRPGIDPIHFGAASILGFVPEPSALRFAAPRAHEKGY